MKRLLKRKPMIIFFSVIVALVLFSVIFVLCINLTVWSKTKARVMDIETASEDGTFDCILVLGAGVKANGEPSHMLEDRLKVGIQLYQKGASSRMLMSGDHMSEDYDEVGTMKRYAIEAGVPGNVIFLDHAGLSTYESVWRAKEIYGAKRILIVTQEYHLYRALYIAESLGVEAYGVSADLRSYRKMPIYEVREMAARVKDFFYVRSRPIPANVGEPVDLSGDGDSTNVNKFFQ